MIFSSAIAAHRRSAMLLHLQTAPEHKAANRKLYDQFIEALDLAYENQASATESERNDYIRATTDGIHVFEKTVTVATDKYKLLVSQLAVDDSVGHQDALETYSLSVRAANDEYDLTVGPSEFLLKEVEAQALVVLEATMLEAFGVYHKEMLKVIHNL